MVLVLCWYFLQISKKISPPQDAVEAMSGDPLGVRTRDPILKRDVLYLLS